MKKTTLAIGAVLFTGGVFAAGVAVGNTHNEPKYTAAEEIKFDDLGGPKLAGVTGDYKKGAYGGFMTLPAGFTSPPHMHTGAYEAVMIKGTTSHWVKGEDGAKAKKLGPGSYWSMPGKMEHVSACDKGTDCLFWVMQKAKFDFKEVKAAPAKADPKAPAKAPEPAKKTM